MNVVSLVGRLTQDLVLRDNTNGDKYLFFTVATNEYRNGQEAATFVPCVAWGQIAENMTRFLKKGSLVGVSGRLSVRNRQENNQYQTTVNVQASRVEFLDSKSARTEAPNLEPTESFTPLEPVSNIASTPIKANNDVTELDDSILWD